MSAVNGAHDVKAGDFEGRRPLMIAVLGNLVEWYDANLYGLLAIFLAKAFFSFSDPATALLATYATLIISFIIRPVAGLLLGRLADLRGHRFVLILTINLMTLGTVGMGVLPTYAVIGIWSPILLVVCRILQGVGASAEYTVAVSYVLERGPSNRGHYLTGWCLAATNIGPLIASLVAMLLTIAYGDRFFESGAWRYPFLLSAPLGLIALYLRRQMINDGADRRIPQLVDRQTKLPLFVALRGQWMTVARLIAMSAGNRATAAIIQSYVVTMLIQHGLGAFVSMSVSMLLYMIGIPAVVLAGSLSDKIGGRLVLIISFALFAIVIIPLFLLLNVSMPIAIAGFVVLQILNNTVAPALSYAFIMAFPQAVRGAASAVQFNLGTALIGSTAPLVATWLSSRTGSEIAFGWYLATWCIVSCAAAIFGYPKQLASH